MRIGVCLIGLVLLCSPLSPPSLAADPSPSLEPMDWTVQESELQNQTQDSSPEKDTLLEGYTFSEPSALPAQGTPPPLMVPSEKSKSPVNALIWLAVGTVIILSVILLGRRLYFENAFGARFRLPPAQVSPRLGGSYSGGLGAAISLKTGEPLPPER